MGNTVMSGELLGSSTTERVAMCRKLAAEAAGLAEQSANPETRRCYLDIKREWEDLAAEMLRISGDHSAP